MKILVADDEIGAHLQILGLSLEFISENDKEEINRQISYEDLHRQLNDIIESIGMDRGKDLMDLTLNVNSITILIPPLLDDVYDEIDRLQGELEKAEAEDDEDTILYTRNRLERCVQALKPTQSIENTVKFITDKLPFELNFCGKLQEALEELSREEEGHDYDVVISDWRFEGSGSALGGLLVLLAAERRKKDKQIQKGFYTGYETLLIESLDASYIKNYILERSEFEELDKRNLKEGIKDLVESAALSHVSRAPFITLEKLPREMERIFSASNPKDKAEKCKIKIDEKSGEEISFYHLFPFTVLDFLENRVTDYESSKNNILATVDKTKREHALGIVKGIYEDLNIHFFTHEIQNRLFVNFNRSDCIDFWNTKEIKRTIESTIGIPLSSAKPIDLVKSNIINSFNNLYRTIQSGTEINICESLVGLKRQYRLKFNAKPNVPNAGCNDMSSFNLLLQNLLDYSYLEDIMNYQSINKSREEIEPFSWIELGTLKKGIDGLIGEVRGRGGGIINIEVKSVDRNEKKYADVLICQNKTDLTPVRSSKSGLNSSIELIRLFCDVIAIGRFEKGLGAWNFGGYFQEPPDYLYPIPENEAIWILRFPLEV